MKGSKPASYMEGLIRAHALLRQEHDRLERQHRDTPSGMFGAPTKRHHEIMGATRTLVQLGERLLNEIRQAVDRQKEGQ